MTVMSIMDSFRINPACKNAEMADKLKPHRNKYIGGISNASNAGVGVDVINGIALEFKIVVKLVSLLKLLKLVVDSSMSSTYVKVAGVS
jgi:hypothetical protein